MASNRYQIYAKAVNTVFFLSEEYLEARESEGMKVYKLESLF